MTNDSVDVNNTILSGAQEFPQSNGVRAVVTLKSSINVIGNNIDGWSYSD